MRLSMACTAMDAEFHYRIVIHDHTMNFPVVAWQPQPRSLPRAAPVAATASEPESSPTGRHAHSPTLNALYLIFKFATATFAPNLHLKYLPLA